MPSGFACARAGRIPAATLACLPGALALFFLAIPPAHALPVGRLSWDGCDPVVTNKNWSGPGTCVQVISAVGLAPEIGSIALSIDTGATFDAWDFDDLDPNVAECQPASALTISSEGAGCAAAAVAEFVYARQIWITQPHRGGFILDVHLDPGFEPEPGTRYAVARLAFDHSHSVEGEAVPGSGNCGHVEVPVCFAASSSLYRVGRTEFPLPLDSDYLTWQDFNAENPGRPCPGAVPVRETTWGQIKGAYR